MIIENYGAPTKHTVGELKDVYFDLHTGDRYVCEAVYSITNTDGVNKGYEHEYEWVLDKDPIVYISQKVNEDGSCDLELSTEIKRGQPYVCTQLKDGTLVLATAAHDVGKVDTLRAVSGVYLNGKKIRIIPTGKAISKIADVYNKTVAELTADDLRGLTTISASFQEWNSILRYLEIPNTVLTIGVNAFHRCYGVKTIIFEPDSRCTKIDNQAFAFTSVSEIDIPDSVETIGTNVFYQDQGNAIRLKKATLGSGIKSIGNNFFYSGHILEVILNKSCVDASDVPTLGNSLGAKCTVYVPDTTTQALLQKATNWSASTIKLISELQEEV